MSKAVLAIAGAGLIVTGIWMIYPPLSLIAAGLVCIASALGIHRIEGSK